VGMRAECVVPEAQCAIKRSNKKPTPKSIASSPAVPGGPGGGGGGGSAPAADYRLKLARPLKPEEEELINQVYRLMCTVHRLWYYVRYQDRVPYSRDRVPHLNPVPYLDRVPGSGTLPGPALYQDRTSGTLPGRRYQTGTGHYTEPGTIGPGAVSQRKLFFTKVFQKCAFSSF
jgi:hypothetical protein